MLQRDSKGSLEKRLASYGAMSLAVASGVLAGPAHAASFLYTDTSSWPLNSTATGTVYFNPATGGYGHSSTAAFKLFHQTGTHSSGSRLIIWGIASGAGVAGTTNLATKFGVSSAVSAGHAAFFGIERLEFSSSGNHRGNFNTGDDAYVGLFLNGHYGWARVSISSGYQAQLLGFEYQTGAGSPATGSDVPEPSSLLLLAMGAAGIAAYRRKIAGSAKPE